MGNATEQTKFFEFFLKQNQRISSIQIVWKSQNCANRNYELNETSLFKQIRLIFVVVFAVILTESQYIVALSQKFCHFLKPILMWYIIF